ncbi:hypothetical protein TL16_g08838 [Triparma laevis f. inornata]|uniref:Uncharacterized protein n=1 Tax=Triparma laevis f. inornata TaxID=1714386 RepID=A0A9W7AYC0_9STRA|nr:hypothetical protein TL16_g08838 [Triparma laevis f. inornata]
MSVFTASFVSTGASFDMDVDKHTRVETPDFYGYVPDGTKKKVKVFVCMFLMSACQLSAKALASALCAVESGTIVAFYLVCDVLLFFAYKLQRRDFTYWFPIYGKTRVLSSALIQIGAKMIVDFTASVHHRHSIELGGSYWAFTLLSTPLVCFYFGTRYLEYMDSKEGETRKLTMVLDATQVYGMVSRLLAVQVATFVSFLKNTTPK